jgi:hypothetical protein
MFGFEGSWKLVFFNQPSPVVLSVWQRKQQSSGMSSSTIGVMAALMNSSVLIVVAQRYSGGRR